MGQRQLHLLASHMRLRPGATADQVRTFPHVQPRPSLLSAPLPPLPSSGGFRVPARPPSARMASTLLRMRATALALSLYTTLCTHHLPLFVSFPDRSECELYNEVRYSVWHTGFPIENDAKR